MEESTAPARFWSLDALRGGCATVVFLSHWHLWCGFAPVGAGQNFIHAFLQNCHEWLIFSTWPTGGHHPAVLAFFVLSGFCIHYPAEWRLAHGNPHFSAGDYYWRRFLRIMPVYWVASLLAGINGVRLCSLGLTAKLGWLNYPAWRDRCGWSRKPGCITC